MFIFLNGNLTGLHADEISIPTDSLKTQTDLSYLQNENANYISTLFTKYVYTYIFTNQANLKLPTAFGIFTIHQNYQGSYLRIAENPTRDDENWYFGYEIPLHKSVKALVKQNWQFTSDSRNIGLNQLMRLNGLAGLSYSPFNEFNLDALFGMENNNQLDLKSQGAIYQLNGNFNLNEFDNINFNSNLHSNFINLNDGRKNRDINANAFLKNIFGDESDLSFTLNYRNLQNNLLGYQIKNGILPIEIRNENNISGNFLMNYKLSDAVNLNLDLRMQILNVDRNYKQEISEIPYSSFNRNIEQTELYGNTGLFIDIGKLHQKLTLGFASHNEKNNLTKNFSDIELAKYQLFESQRDYNSGRVNIFSQTQYNLNSTTYIIGTYFSQLLRYDTPSDYNFDDRDELINIYNLRFFHRFSRQMNFTLTFENRQNHLVYIFSERSSLNNWNKVYRFSPEITLRTSKLTWNPRFEVLANYTVYDFAAMNSSINSFSFRQVLYSDSLMYNFNDKYSWHNIWKAKYNERGILYWSDFSESPQTSNYEIYVKSIFRKDYAKNVWIGVGGNYYRYTQIRLNNNSQIEYNLESFSPEISINYVYGNWNMSILGWYEFQTIKSRIKNQITNLSINVNLQF
ncbi:MAG: hypothetical protein A2X64_06865 [Ignavibacteria bacterium GWF2_33_9]|nr:MAG: hypothetical protein A2X64_06865 [Ignavibacteria bacterium GWF2_33_9]